MLPVKYRVQSPNRIETERSMAAGEVAGTPLQIPIAVKIEACVDVACDWEAGAKRLVGDADVCGDERAVGVELVAAEDVDVGAAPVVIIVIRHAATAAAVGELAGFERVRGDLWAEMDVCCFGAEAAHLDLVVGGFCRRCPYYVRDGVELARGEDASVSYFL